MEEQILAFIGKVVAIAGGSVTVAFLTFRFLGKSWIENKFSERLEVVRHEHAKELQQLRMRVDSLLNGAIRLQEKEFEVLPAAWALLSEAFVSLDENLAPLKEYLDVSSLPSDELVEILKGLDTEWSQSEILELLSLHGEVRQQRFVERINWKKLVVCSKAVSQSSNYVSKYGLFMSTDLKAAFGELNLQLFHHMSGRRDILRKEAPHTSTELSTSFKNQVVPLYNSLEQLTHRRLQSHGHLSTSA